MPILVLKARSNDRHPANSLARTRLFSWSDRFFRGSRIARRKSVWVVRQRLEGVRKKTTEENRLRPALLLCKGEWIEIARCYPKWIRANPHHTTDNPNPNDSDLDKSPRSKGSAYSHKVGWWECRARRVFCRKPCNSKDDRSFPRV